eukprot:5764463-Amphidinium_carterae.1
MAWPTPLKLGSARQTCLLRTKSSPTYAAPDGNNYTHNIHSFFKQIAIKVDAKFLRSASVSVPEINVNFV